MEGNRANVWVSLIVLFLFAVDLAKNDSVLSVTPAASAKHRARAGGRNEQAGLEGPDKECSITLNQTVWYQPTQQCETLMAKGPCAQGQWLVMSADRRTPICKTPECKFPQISFNKTCVPSRDKSHCPEGMAVTITETGEGVCDCQPAHVYWKPNPTDQERCFRLFRRGPCAQGEYLIFSKRTQRVKCGRNRCPDGQVKPLRSPVCIELDTPGGPCNDIQKGFVLTVNETTMELNCAKPLGNRHLIEAPLLNCSPGSRRDAAGKCRKSII